VSSKSTIREAVNTKKLVLYSGDAHPELAQEIADHLGVELGETNLRQFANGEMHCRYGESIRGADVFIIQTHGGTQVNDALMQQLIMIDAAKRASAKRITAVCPYYGYSRQDRKAEGREPITAKLVADMLTVAGADRVVSVDLHSGQIQGFFDRPVDHLTALPILIECCRTAGSPDDLVIGVARCRWREGGQAARQRAGRRPGLRQQDPAQGCGQRGRGIQRHRQRRREELHLARRHDRHRGHHRGRAQLLVDEGQPRCGRWPPTGCSPIRPPSG